MRLSQPSMEKDVECYPTTYLICGSDGTEPYLETLINQQIRVVCVNLEFAESQNASLIMESGDFNSIKLWERLTSKYTNQIDRIIFDSSTCKFINNEENVWNLSQGLPYIQTILKSNGEIYFDSILYSAISYPMNLFQELSYNNQTVATVLLLPLISENRIQTPVNRRQFQHGIDWNQVEGYQNYLTLLKNTGQFQVSNHHHMTKPYPLSQTTYPVDNYLVLVKKTRVKNQFITTNDLTINANNLTTPS